MSATNEASERASEGGSVMGEPRPTSAIAGHCVDIDGASWHADYTVCPRCRFGLWEDPSTPGRGAFGEPASAVEAFAGTLEIATDVARANGWMR